MTETQELLSLFVRTGSELAFRQLVERYFDLVYSTAIRLVDADTHRAQDVAQIVFTDLARMAFKLSGETMLGGWLHRHTCFVARTLMRGERRREAREKQAVLMNDPRDMNNSLLAQIAPLLDEAINELGPDDRQAILLRFFEGRNLRAVGEALGVSENVAQKRVARAVRELGVLLRNRGFALSAAALASGLAATAVKAAPAGLAALIAAKAFSAAGLAGAAVLTPAKVAVLAKLKAALLSAVIVAGLTTAFFLIQSRTSSQKTNLVQPSSPAQVQALPDGIVGPQDARSTPADRLPGTPEAKTELTGRLKVDGDAVQQAESSSNARPPKTVRAVGLVAPILAADARSGGKIRIEGPSNIHDWQRTQRT
ncbi:MAG TPA: sigma-70 family RNA polymerase sigma factor [Verrucomicrobiae bacterium]|nr:sigma-70 family RNA polymerase sigma factor [Verrucomicrobiae bacterium]